MTVPLPFVGGGFFYVFLAMWFVAAMNGIVEGEGNQNRHLLLNIIASQNGLNLLSQKLFITFIFKLTGVCRSNQVYL